jgi:hypothetical protein
MASLCACHRCVASSAACTFLTFPCSSARFAPPCGHGRATRGAPHACTLVATRHHTPHLTPLPLWPHHTPRLRPCGHTAPHPARSVQVRAVQSLGPNYLGTFASSEAAIAAKGADTEAAFTGRGALHTSLAAAFSPLAYDGNSLLDYSPSGAPAPPRPGATACMAACWSTLPQRPACPASDGTLGPAIAPHACRRSAAHHRNQNAWRLSLPPARPSRRHACARRHRCAAAAAAPPSGALRTLRAPPCACMDSMCALPCRSRR